MEILRYAAFSSTPAGGNPAGVVLDASGVDDDAMAAVAAEVGFSETAFAIPVAAGCLRMRYFSPKVEVPFCGHATIAAAVAYAERHGAGSLTFMTQAGVVPVTTTVGPQGQVSATLTSVTPKTTAVPSTELADLLAALQWSADDLDPALPPRAAYAGAWHPVIAARSRDRLARLDYDMSELAGVMERNEWATVNLVWRESVDVYHARNPFPVGGVFEDPATGAAAAALGGYLRELGLVSPPSTLTVHQGQDMGRPGTIAVTVPADPSSGIAVSGTAVRI